MKEAPQEHWSSRHSGFARGLALSGPYAFVGLSKIRRTSAMDGVPLADRREQLKCGVAAVDLRNGQVVGSLEFQTAMEEIFDVQLLPGRRAGATDWAGGTGALDVLVVRLTGGVFLGPDPVVTGFEVAF